LPSITTTGSYILPIGRSASSNGWSHRDGNGEESKYTCNDQPAQRDDVDDKELSPVLDFTSRVP